MPSKAFDKLLKTYSFLSSMIVKRGWYNSVLRIKINTKNWIITNGKVASKSKSPPGPVTSEFKIIIEKLTI